MVSVTSFTSSDHSEKGYVRITEAVFEKLMYSHTLAECLRVSGNVILENDEYKTALFEAECYKDTKALLKCKDKIDYLGKKVL